VTLHPIPPFEMFFRFESFINGGVKILNSFNKRLFSGAFLNLGFFRAECRKWHEGSLTLRFVILRVNVER
jgi:hypothetical protein